MTKQELVVRVYRKHGMPNGLTALGFGEADVDALATGAFLITRYW